MRTRSKALLKSELAAEFNISMKTLRKWMALELDQLEPMGYSKHQKFLTPRMVIFLRETLGSALQSTKETN
jgi:hypothetical protein